MQHLSRDHGIKEPLVNHVTDEKIGPPKTIEEFYHFPKRKGWCIDRNDYRLRVLPVLPEASQYGTSRKDFEPKLRRFLQAWLFFGLIFTVVQKDKRPLMKYDDLVKETYITTKDLRNKLEEWFAWESTRPPGQRLRMIRLEAILQFCRRVVRTNLAYIDSKTPPLGYSTEGSNLLYVPDSVILSIMILGETLHDVKSRIAQETGMEMRGWKNEDDSGWGPPRWVLKEMENKKLCPRTIRLLRGQLRSNATLLLAAWLSTWKLVSSSNIAADHGECSDSICLVTPETKDGGYSQRHCEKFCPNKSTCPQSAQAVKQHVMEMIIRDETKRPLLQFKETHNGSHDSLEPEVIEWQPSMPVEYATISHVWSDGFGNPNANTMPVCQLKLIRDLLSKLRPNSTSKTMPFWMDTLMIPVGSDAEIKDVRRKTIRQIPKIFKEASHTIVLDWGLHGIDPDVQKPAQTAMRIIASGWMRRLWTLQEAFVSKSLHISQGKDSETLHYLNDLYRNLEERTDGLTSTLITTVKNQLQSNIMHEQRPTSRRRMTSGSNTSEINEGFQWSPREAAVLVVNAWKAVRWRATANELHETLALASLLDLEFKETSIEVAGLTDPEKINFKDVVATKTRNRDKDQAMKQFWTSYDQKWRDAIPPGIIFLPGDRVQIPGFGWAPRTWLSAHEVDFPDPLSFVDSTAELHDPSVPSSQSSTNRGLRVCFPGFLLFAEHRDILLTANAQSRCFHFPVDQGLQEWYKVEATDDEVSTSLLENVSSEDKSLAIILSRSRPQELPPEIGLLVQIYKRSTETIHTQNISSERKQGIPKAVDTPIDEDEKVALHCEILHRVKVSRDTELSRGYRHRSGGLLEGQGNTFVMGGDDQAELYQVPGILLPGDGDDEICIGETLKTDQIWYVDGLSADWTTPTPVQQGSSRSDSEKLIQPTRRRHHHILRKLRSRNASGAGVKQTEEAQTEIEAAPVMRRGHTAGTPSEPFDSLPHRSTLKKVGTWASTSFKILGGRKK